MAYGLNQNKTAVKIPSNGFPFSSRQGQEPDAFWGEMIYASVLIVDIREAAVAASANGDLNLLYTLMQQWVIEEGGRVNRCNDAGFVALFGAPMPTLGHAQQAVTVAMKMLARLVQINRQRVIQRRPPLRIGLSVNTGELLVGDVQSERWHHQAIVGHTVETAVALSQVSKRAPVHTVLVGAETAVDLRLQHNWYLANLGAVSNNGSGPLETHALVLLSAN